MPLPFFKRSKTEAAAADAAPTSPGDEGTAVQAARVRARRRLIGAVVLLAAGVIGFPVLFETQPRPLPSDIPIQVTSAGSTGSVAPAATGASPSRPMDRPVMPVPADAGNELPAAAPGASAPGPADPPTPAARPVASMAAASARPPVEEAPRAAKPPEPTRTPSAEPRVAPVEAARPAASTARTAPREAVAAEKPKPAASAVAAKGEAAASAPRAGRYVVQVGAFTDPGALRDARQRVEKLGFKSYTQVVETPAGARTRVRVGPFDTREEAERAGARLKSGGLPANLLTL